ncbi:DinB family protein [Brachybacterium sp. JHP9]|uniref:DinB family protein n=1 Tax=Brachybacterium equifaecis TaxID=2910770 RepID=A0ABT0R5X1_9MICO|nr:DinB family protein [Brachybacterium equifaecis]MCL6424315.1 DinB family protein [Brachybacterium equifaecis]
MTSSEKAALLGWLRAKRAHVLSQLDGLSDAQLRTPVLPSGWSPLGLVRHLTLSDERFWCEVVIAGGPLDFWPEGEGADWTVGADESASAVLDAYRAASAASDAILEARSLDDPLGAPSEAPPGYADVRAVLVHLLVETATHAGHLDAARELIDGRQHLVLS